jgi:uncharacterized membrane protein YkvA (DUF1232 family)
VTVLEPEPVPRGHGSDPVTGDSFPGEQLRALLRRLPRYLRLAWRLAGEPRLSRRRKAGVLAAAGYLASPVDLIPGIIPILGQLDDMAVALLALRSALRSLDPITRERQLAEVGLAAGDLDADLGTLVAMTGWLLRRGANVGRRLALVGAAASVTVGRAAGRAAARAARAGTPVVVRSGGRLARATASAVGRTGRWGGRALARRVRGDGGGGGEPDVGPGDRDLG